MNRIRRHRRQWFFIDFRPYKRDLRIVVDLFVVQDDGNAIMKRLERLKKYGYYKIFLSCLDTFLSLFTCFIGGFPAFLAFSSRAFEVEVCLIEGGAMFKRFLKDAKRSSADGIL